MNKHSLNILIVEDELLIAEMLKEMLLDLNYNVVAIAKTYDLALFFLEKHKEINFAFLDINLSESKNGFDVAKQINEVYQMPFVFLTSYSTKETIKEAINLKPDSYLLKPFTKTDLFVTLELVAAKAFVSDKTTIIKDGHLSIKLFHRDILWIKSDNIYLEVKTEDKTYLVRNSLDKFYEELNDIDFLRIHRSYVVNLKQIKAVNGQYIIIGAEKIPMSRSLRDELLIKFNS